MAVLPLEYYSDLTDPKIVDWLLVHSGGILGELANILKLATKRAIRLAKEKIDLEILNQLNYRSPLLITETIFGTTEVVFGK